MSLVPVFDDEMVLTYRALRELDRVYDGYRAAARAHAVVLRQLARRLSQQSGSAEEQLAVRQRLGQRFALAQETDLVVGARSDQIRRRMAELLEGGGR